MDDSLTLLHTLTWRSRMYGLWQRLNLYLTGARYTAKLMRLAHKNIRVLRHFHYCREVEQLQPERVSRFWHFNFYTETFRQCLQLFSPIRPALPIPEHITPSASPSRRVKKKAHTKRSVSRRTSRRTSACQQQTPQRRAPVVHTPALLETSCLPALSSTATLTKIVQEPRARTHWKIRFTLHTGLLWMWYLPSACIATCVSFLRIKSHKAQQRQFFQQAQLTLLQEHQRIASSTQTALFLSLATAIDLKAARELTAAGQLVGKHRRQKIMTAEDMACFDQSLNALDGNHEIIRIAVL